jgi:hypothetical protein
MPKTRDFIAYLKILKVTMEKKAKPKICSQNIKKPPNKLFEPLKPLAQ